MGRERRFAPFNPLQSPLSMTPMNEERAVVAGALRYLHPHHFGYKLLDGALHLVLHLLGKDEGAIEIHLLETLECQQIECFGLAINISTQECKVKGLLGQRPRAVDVAVTPRVGLLIQAVDSAMRHARPSACAGSQQKEKERQQVFHRIFGKRYLVGTGSYGFCELSR